MTDASSPSPRPHPPTALCGCPASHRAGPADAETADGAARQTAPVPEHLAVILDGNRRWAEAQRVTVVEAYQKGAERVHDLLTWCDRSGIAYVTVWALSQDNLRRAPNAVSAILTAVIEGLRCMARTGRWPIRFIGALQQLPAHQAALHEIERETAHARGTTLNVALAYSGRSDIVDAVVALLQHHGTEHLDSGAVEQLLAGYLSTAGQPDLDLVIRTSGEQRLSGFMPWQTAQAELYFTDVPWPAFDRCNFDQALRWYADRDRRFGL
ncbi:polyprenyl diphosphate synthase [Streptomyces sp. NPDC051243]|uniref:polyprenyl diphosphate synthase n=1 Tax=Streptomyces sp. NPDC051243 TaxID=3365646 RepID=UPI00379F18A1